VLERQCRRAWRRCLLIRAIRQRRRSARRSLGV